MKQKITDEVLAKAKSWAINPLFDSNFKQEIQNLIDKGEFEELSDRFYKDLEFGTGGLRGIMGVGSNRMNIYTVRKVTQGLADYIMANTQSDSKAPSVAIAYDSRNFSKEFAQETAAVLGGNGIQVHIFPDLRPTPMLSYAVRYLECSAGIMITASHNPAEYNGYKAYWSDGGQVVEPHDKGIIDCVTAIDDFSKVQYQDYQTGLDNGSISIISEDLDKFYYRQVIGLSHGNLERNSKFGIVYTPLHGTGNLPVRHVLRARGFRNVKVVAEQELPDGDFPTVDSPNPEESKALEMAVAAADDSHQLILATDPDGDRLGVMVRHNETWIKLNGNQIGQILLEYYLLKNKELKRIPEDGVFVTTIVTSSLGIKIALKYGLKVKETLTGFKYIAAAIREMEEKGTGTFVFGTEESHGYLFSSFVRDKDAVMAAMIFAEICADFWAQGETVLDRLAQISSQFEYHKDALINKVIEGENGAHQISAIMKFLRESPPKMIGGSKVFEIRDYLSGDIINTVDDKIVGNTNLPKSNVIAFFMSDGSRITARPSGTEPKIKFYFNLCGHDPDDVEFAERKYIDEFCKLIDEI